jgi:hypothetical protein
MVRYFYAWMPVVIVLGTVVVLSSAYLALIVLMLLVPVALAGLAWAIVGVPYMVGRAVNRRWHARTGPTPQAAAALSPAEHQE